MTLKTIVQNTLLRAGLPPPDFVMTSADDGVAMLRGIVNQEGKDLSQRHQWQALTKEHVVSLTAAEVQPSGIPDDFDRIVADTMYNRSRNCPVEGPLTAQDWQQYKSDGFAGPDQMFRQRGSALMLIPAPALGETLAFEYVSRNWVSDDKQQMNADDDTAILDEELITLGCVWRYLHAKGMDYGQAFQDYEAQVANAIARDGGSRSLNFANRSARNVRPLRNVVQS